MLYCGTLTWPGCSTSCLYLCVEQVEHLDVSFVNIYMTVCRFYVERELCLHEFLTLTRVNVSVTTFVSTDKSKPCH